MAARARIGGICVEMGKQRLNSQDKVAGRGKQEGSKNGTGRG